MGECTRKQGPAGNCLPGTQRGSKSQVPSSELHQSPPKFPHCWDTPALGPPLLEPQNIQLGEEHCSGKNKPTYLWPQFLLPSCHPASEDLSLGGRDEFSPTRSCPLSLTLLKPGGTRRDFLVWIHRGLWRQGVKLLSADHIHLLEVLHLLLHWKRKTMKQPIALFRPRPINSS